MYKLVCNETKKVLGYFDTLDEVFTFAYGLSGTQTVTEVKEAA